MMDQRLTLKSSIFTVALLLAACGGGGSDSNASSTSTTLSSTSSSTSSSSTTTASTTTTTAAQTATSYTAYTGPNTSPALTMTVTPSGSGSSSIVVSNHSGAFTAFDSSNNATAVNGSFTRVLALHGTAVGQLCSGTAGNYVGMYSFTLATAQPATLDELKGKVFQGYEDCAAAAFQITVNNDGSATVNDTGAIDNVPAALFAEIFSTNGLTENNNGVTENMKAIAYKVNIGGGTRYVVFERGQRVPDNGTSRWLGLWVSN